MPPDSERFALDTPLPLRELALPDAHAAPPGSVRGLALLGLGQEGDLSFCDRPPAASLALHPGSWVLTTQGLAAGLRERFPGVGFLVAADPRAVFIDLGHDLLARDAVAVDAGVPRPFGIAPDARIGPHTVVHAQSRIDAGARIGANCVIHRGCWIGPRARIGDNTVIGVEGINAYRGVDGQVRSFPHFAGVLVGADTAIGAGAVLARGILTHTRVGAGCVVGNLCNVGHGVHVGDRVWMSVGCLIGGHTRIGDDATLGLGARVRDNLQIGAGANIGMGSVVVKPVAAGRSVFGNPARPVPPISAGPAR